MAPQPRLPEALAQPTTAAAPLSLAAEDPAAESRPPPASQMTGDQLRAVSMPNVPPQGPHTVPPQYASHRQPPHQHPSPAGLGQYGSHGQLHRFAGAQGGYMSPYGGGRCFGAVPGGLGPGSEPSTPGQGLQRIIVSLGHLTKLTGVRADTAERVLEAVPSVFHQCWATLTQCVTNLCQDARQGLPRDEQRRNQMLRWLSALAVYFFLHRMLILVRRLARGAMRGGGSAGWTRTLLHVGLLAPASRPALVQPRAVPPTRVADLGSAFHSP